MGRTLLSAYGDDIKVRARAKAAAGSDARMNGCSMPVIINSGSGNQGMTCSLPVIEFAKEGIGAMIAASTADAIFAAQDDFAPSQTTPPMLAIVLVMVLDTAS